MKTCVKCNIFKSFDNFPKNINKCILCLKQYKKEHYQKNKEKYITKANLYYNQNSEKVKQNRKLRYYMYPLKSLLYNETNSIKIKNNRKKYRQANADKFKEYSKKYNTIRKKTDALYRFTCNIRALISSSFKRHDIIFKKRTKTQMLLGCTIPELRDHLASKFQPGMTFENHGQWHIDHIIPLASAKSQSEIEKLCHYTNLQPLWAADNIRKSNKI